MNRAYAVLYAVAMIDSAGIGLVFPILPTLLRHLAAGRPVAIHYGGLVATFALMQFLFAPVLGVLSDRFGRRPVLLLSLAGGALDYLLTGFAPSLWLLYVARMVAGVTAANLAVVSSTIADLAPPSERPRRFGAMNAAYGVGWIVGPVLGGTLGQLSPVLPFVAAAVLSLLNLLLGLFLLPAPYRPPPVRAPVRLAQLNAFASLRWLATVPALSPLVTIWVLLCLLGQIPGSLWVLYGQDRYGWSAAEVGWSFACFGLLFALSQVALTGPLTRRLGDRGCLMLGMGLDSAGNVLMGLAGRGWMPFAIMPLLTASSVGTPALQGAMSRAVGDSRQGELQGSLAGLSNLAGIAGPVLATLTFSATRHVLPGLVWFAGGAGYAGCALLAAWQSRRPVAIPEPSPP